MNFWRLSLIAAGLLLLVVPGIAAAAPAPTAAPAPSVPLELQPWIEWVKAVELPPGEGEGGWFRTSSPTLPAEDEDIVSEVVAEAKAPAPTNTPEASDASDGARA